MANKRFYQFLYSKQPKLSMISGMVTFAANGTVASGSTFTAGVYSITGDGSGTFKIKLSDNYNAFVGADMTPLSGISATSTPVASLVGSTTYQISTVGNTDWSTLGVDTDYTVVAGMPFVANNVAGSGTGVAKAIVASNVNNFQVVQSPSALLTNNSPNYVNATGVSGKGSSIYFQSMGVSSAGGGSIVTVNPTGSTQMYFKLWFRDSSALPGI